jgi:ribonuclease HI
MAIQPRVKVYFDGGCRPAPSGMETAVVVKGRTYLQRDLGSGSSLEAEWLALIRALEIARELGLSNVVFIGDALAVILPAIGAVKCRGSSVQYLEKLNGMSTSSARLNIRYIKRTQNLAGIALARLHAR